MDLITSPLFERLQRAEHVLLAGAGGGFDIYCGLPLYFRLRELGKRVSLANLSFTTLSRVDGRVVAPGLMEVRAETQGPVHYFPEGVLARWFQARGEAVSIYCFDKVGVAPVSTAWTALQAELGFGVQHPTKPWQDIPVQAQAAGG
ncbi:hypothetical protein [Corallococcus caeni]|uniref:DUF1152 domain-containing protein n=1 Tax=Corallococcus caeni TaxID=3082388 RepID=A0ABQ6R4M9_9BACT|nr:hypothetical protein ASNO1_75240 [Corallococcus sp. NO1]